MRKNMLSLLVLAGLFASSIALAQINLQKYDPATGEYKSVQIGGPNGITIQKDTGNGVHKDVRIQTYPGISEDQGNTPLSAMPSNTPLNCPNGGRQANITRESGSDAISVSCYHDSAVSSGSGEDSIMLAGPNRNLSVIAGSGGDHILLSGHNDTVQVDCGSGSDDVSFSGTGKIWAQGGSGDDIFRFKEPNSAYNITQGGGYTVYTHRSSGAIVQLNGFEMVLFAQ